MRIVISQFMSLDGVVQAPGEPAVGVLLRPGGHGARPRRGDGDHRCAALRASHVADDGGGPAGPGIPSPTA